MSYSQPPPQPGYPGQAAPQPPMWGAPQPLQQGSKGNGALIGILAGVVALALVGGLVAWYTLKGPGEMEPYTVVMPQTILDGAYDKELTGDKVPTISLTEPAKAAQIGVTNAAGASASFSNKAHVATSEAVTISVIGIYGDVAEPEAAVDAVFAHMHESQEETADSAVLDVRQVEPVKITGEQDVAGFDGTIMKCETLTTQPEGKSGLDTMIYVSRCVWGDPSAVGIVQAQGQGLQPLNMLQTGFAEKSKKIREEVRTPR